MEADAMNLELCVLASGSGGNCSLVRAGHEAMVIDAGIGPLTADRRMMGTGLDLTHIRAICLTHLDGDHINPAWFRVMLRHDIRIFVPANQIKLLRRLARLEEVLKPVMALTSTFDKEVFHPLPEVACTPIRLHHDKKGSFGFLLQSEQTRLAYATDFGRPVPELVELFAGAGILAIESNYDPEMQLASARPQRLKKRIMGGAGHLSNPQALELVRNILDRTVEKYGTDQQPYHLVLLHRSRQCNCPVKLRALFETDDRLARILTLSNQYQRTEWLGAPDRKALPGEQLYMFNSASNG
jgi:ribonuclease BN (tRNA processing enzyme)